MINNLEGWANIDYVIKDDFIKIERQMRDIIIKEETTNKGKRSSSAENVKIDNGKAVKINTNKCRGELKCIRMIIKKRQWKEVFNDKCDIYWTGTNLPFEEFSWALKARVNRIPGMTELSHKRETSYYLNKFQEFYPENFDFYPKTFLIPGNFSQLKEFRKNNKVY